MAAPRSPGFLATFAACAAALLAGCAAPGFTLPGRDVQFELAGRIAMKYRDEAGSGNIAWRHALESDEMLITSPIGQGIARIVRDGKEVVLRTQDGQELKAEDAETLTERALGFRIPLAGLADWVRGRAGASPEPLLVKKDAQGRLAELQQGGWTIEYQEYAGALPSRLRLVYPGIELRLAISEWK
jgi:outer membrane lipoprotein LolB